MLWLNGLMQRRKKGSYGWLDRCSGKMNPILVPPVLEPDLMNEDDECDDERRCRVIQDLSSIDEMSGVFLDRCPCLWSCCSITVVVIIIRDHHLCLFPFSHTFRFFCHPLLGHLLISAAIIFMAGEYF